MGEIRDAGWLNTLTEVEGAISACLSALDKYEVAFGGLLCEHYTDPHPAAPPPALTSEWDDKLAVATQQADEVERLLAEQESAWSGWLNRFAAWRQSLKHPQVSGRG